MTLKETLESKGSELGEILRDLGMLRDEVKRIQEKFPPLWSENVIDLKRFLGELEEWIKSPQVKRIKELLRELKKYAKDKRNFKGLTEEYLLGVLGNLEEAVSFISEIENDTLKSRSAKKTLDVLLEQESIDDLVERINSYRLSFKQFAEEPTANDLEKTVKEHLLEQLADTENFSADEVERAKGIPRKALNSVDLLADSGIAIQVFVNEFNNTKSVDDLWSCANEVRNFLRDTDIDLKKKADKPFAGAKNFLLKRRRCTKKSRLDEVHRCLEKISEDVKRWKQELADYVRKELAVIENIAVFAGFHGEFEEVDKQLKEELEESFRVSKIYLLYKKLMKIKRKAEKSLEGLLLEKERRIIENMERADELVDDMKEDFWKALRSLRDKKLVKIQVSRE